MIQLFFLSVNPFKFNEYVWGVFAKCAILSELEVSFKHSRFCCSGAFISQPHTCTYLAPPFGQTHQDIFFLDVEGNCFSDTHQLSSATSWLGHVRSEFVSNVPRFFVSWSTYTTSHIHYKVKIIIILIYCYIYIYTPFSCPQSSAGARTNMCSQTISSYPLKSSHLSTTHQHVMHAKNTNSAHARPTALDCRCNFLRHLFRGQGEGLCYQLCCWWSRWMERFRCLSLMVSHGYEIHPRVR